MNVPVNYLILDERKRKDFNKLTISGYKKADIFKALFNALSNRKIEEACYWTVELHCSGHLDQWWKKLLIYHSEHIHINCPYLPQWIWKTHEKYIQLEENFDPKYVHETRNNQEIRNLISDVIMIFVLASKSEPFKKKDLPPVSPLDFNKARLIERIIAKNSYMICNILDQGDPREIQLGLNEFAIHLNTEMSNFNDTIYWIQWLLMYELECKNNNIPILCKGIVIGDVDQKWYNDWIWYCWKIILKEVDYRNNDPLQKQIYSLYKIYKIGFNSTTRKVKIAHIYHSVYMLKNSVNWNIPLIKEYHLRVQACGNINQLYKSVAVDSKTGVNEGNAGKLLEIREKCKGKIGKKKQKLKEKEKEERLLDEKTKYLRHIPKKSVVHIGSKEVEERKKTLMDYLKKDDGDGDGDGGDIFAKSISL